MVAVAGEAAEATVAQNRPTTIAWVLGFCSLAGGLYWLLLPVWHAIMRFSLPGAN